jgi:hypothetical protein
MAKGSGLFGLVWSPFKHLFQASGESAQKIGSGAGKIAKVGLGTVESVGSSFAKHSNQTIRNITRRVGKLGRFGRSKSRRGGRR